MPAGESGHGNSGGGASGGSRRGAIPPFIVMDVMRAANARAAAGARVLHLEVGQPSSAAPEPVLQATRDALAAGARGAVYGRNVWQADDPVEMCRLLRGVIHGDAA